MTVNCSSWHAIFIHRVYSHATLQIVRELIEDQLETDVIPEQYVFLRSVGRCLAVVSISLSRLLTAWHWAIRILRFAKSYVTLFCRLIIKCHRPLIVCVCMRYHKTVVQSPILDCAMPDTYTSGWADRGRPPVQHLERVRFEPWALSTVNMWSNPPDINYPYQLEIQFLMKNGEGKQSYAGLKSVWTDSVYHWTSELVVDLYSFCLPVLLS